MSDEFNPRKQLAEAITKHAFALQKIEQCESTLTKARNLHCSLQADLADLATLDSDITTARASNLATALANDEAPMFEEPGGFSTAILKKQKIESELVITVSSIAVLEAELDAAKQNADDLGIAIEHAAEAVVAKEAEELATSFMTKLEALRKDQYVLSALQHRWIRRARSENVVGVNGEPVRSVRQVKFPPIVRNAVLQSIIGDSELHGGILVRNAMTMAVAAYWSALKDNPDATFDAGELMQKDRLSPYDESTNSNIVKEPAE